MLTYLFQATAIWALLLVLYEVLYRNRPAFTLNRLYLLSALLAGALLPLVPLTLPGPAGGDTGIIAGNILQPVNPIVQAVLPPQEAAVQHGIGLTTVAGWIYLAGAILMAVVSLRGLVYILRTAIYGSFTQVDGYRIFRSNRETHAPFSFMGWIFIAGPEQYSQRELLFVLRHEDAHNRRRHWLDVLLVQLFCIVFWFHPLVWRYRYCLKLVHEYEADHITAGDEGYDYGHFLLRQTLLKGVPAIAHSFHFSPIKHRIAMLTQQRKTQAWKYSFWIPAVCACLLLAAKPAANNERVRVGDKTHFRGHDFYWTPLVTDSVHVQDPVTGEMTWVVVQKMSEVFKMDDDAVISTGFPTIVPPRFLAGADFYAYVGEKFRKQFPQLPDSIRYISINNIVVDESGKVRYYDLGCYASVAHDMNLKDSPFKAYADVINKVIDESGDWAPAETKASPHRKVKSQLTNGNIYLKSR